MTDAGPGFTGQEGAGEPPPVPPPYRAEPPGYPAEQPDQAGASPSPPQSGYPDPTAPPGYAPEQQPQQSQPGYVPEQQPQQYPQQSQPGYAAPPTSFPPATGAAPGAPGWPQQAASAPTAPPGYVPPPGFGPGVPVPPRRTFGIGAVVRSLWFTAAIAALAVIIAPLITYPVAYSSAIRTETDDLQNTLDDRVNSGGALSVDDQKKLATQLTDAGVPAGLFENIFGFDKKLHIDINMSSQDLAPDVCTGIAQKVLTVVIELGYRTSAVELTQAGEQKPACETSAISPVVGDD